MVLAPSPAIRKLHLGCGRDVRSGWINLDLEALPGVDVVADLDRCASQRLPFEDDRFDEVLASHLLEHLREPLAFMQELHRVCREGAIATFHTPHGASDDAFEDPTHFRQYFPDSFGFFSQPAFWRADYGYHGDWQPEVVELRVEEERYKDASDEQVEWEVRHLRNTVVEMRTSLRCVKPIREPMRDLIRRPRIEIMRV
ncbi:MAG TPA: methyltransferase domain-containing protein [Fimbriimonadaceae bacterium]|nr:methyltransferase domain-containing protein [Fimbriimonadaceae bacterium]HRJ97315.1 methyltransferase domain-containing protein [Fimbriimonadaceae bacterium]